MAKRAWEHDDDDDHETLSDARSVKRGKISNPDRLSRLSDELILRILSYLTVSQLIVCQRVSHKYEQLAGDGQLWKSQYYNRYVRPRASRIPGLRDSGPLNESLHFASKASAWLDEEYLVRGGRTTNWKRQYKLRHNWSKGSCAVNEIDVAQEAPVPPILVEMLDGVICTADPKAGLRAWSVKADRKFIASIAFPATDEGSSPKSSPPTSLAIGARDIEDSNPVVVGFEDGSFSVFSLQHRLTRFQHRYSHSPSLNGVITVVDITWPLVLTLTATQSLTLYQFKDETADDTEESIMKPPQILHSLKSHTVWPPLSTSLRMSASSILMCIAYALPTYLSGWTVGIQEIKVTRTGELQSSRTASAIDQHYRPLAFSSQPIIHHLPPSLVGHRGISLTAEFRHIHSKPTSLSYTHPYLLVSHTDNTLTLYLVTSNAESLSISPGSRLWGHTSSVSGAHVGVRGKAISVSRRGDELRIWELEGGFTSSTARKRLANRDLSVQIRPEASRQLHRSKAPQSRLDLMHGSQSGGEKAGISGVDSDASDELTLTRGWIGFDEENVVFLKEENQGRQVLVVYDFT